VLLLAVSFALSVPSALWAGQGEEKKTSPKDGKKFESLDVNGKLESTDTPDKVRKTPCKVYRVHFTKGKIYQIDLISSDFDAFLRLEDSKGEQVAEDDDSGGGLNARIIYQAPKSGDYKVIATNLRANVVGNYHLRVNERGVTVAKVQELKLGDEPQTVPSELNASDDKCTVPPTIDRPQKLYSIKMKAGQRYVIDLESKDFDSYLHVLDSTKKRLASDDDSGGDLNSRISFTPPADGTYYIVATCLDNQFGNFTLKVRKE
jgi:serine protease Do